MSRLMLDTSGYVRMSSGHPKAADAVRRTERVLLPVVVLGELLAGFEHGTRREQNRQLLAEFQREHRVTTVSVAAETAKFYTHIYAHLRSMGRPIPTNDIWIAAKAMEHGAELLTADAHFQHIPQILVNHISD